MSETGAPPREERFEYRRSLKTVKSYPFIHRFLPVDRLLVRPLAGLVVRAVFRTGVTPNQITATSFFMALVAGVVYLGGTYPYFAVGGCLAMLSCVLDNADGMLARAKNMTSRYGAFLDLFLDRIADFAVLAGIAFGLYRTSGDPRVLMLGLLTLGLYFLQVALYYLRNIYTGLEKNGEGAEAKNLAVFVILLFSLAGRPVGVLLAVGLMGVLGTVIKLVRFLKLGRDPSAYPVR